MPASAAPRWTTPTLPSWYGHKGHLDAGFSPGPMGSKQVGVGVSYWGERGACSAPHCPLVSAPGTMVTPLQMALETLAEAALFAGEEARGLAFTRAASVLRCLPRALQGTHELSGLPCIGGHSHRVLQVPFQP